MAANISPHIAEELPRLLTGEATREVVHAAAEHLRHCVDCTQDLVSAVIAHATLSSAQRFAPEIVQREIDALPQVREALADHADLPDLSAVFAQARLEAAAAPLVARRAKRARFTKITAMSVSAAAVAAAIVVGATVLTSGGSSSSRIQLSAYGVGHTNASATFTDSNRLRIDATSLPALDATHRYEVWLTDAQRTRMQPVGWIDTNGKADLTVPDSLAHGFGAIEVSVQQVTGADYAYSGTSVLRGTY